MYEDTPMKNYIDRINDSEEQNTYLERVSYLGWDDAVEKLGEPWELKIYRY